MSLCVDIQGSEIAGAGFFAIQKPFPAPRSEVFTFALTQDAQAHIGRDSTNLADFEGWSNEKCVWSVLVFEYPECSLCDKQIESAVQFQQEGFGSSEKLMFYRILGRQSFEREFKKNENLFSLLVDPSDRLSEQLAIQAVPASALVDPKGFVRGYYPGYVEYSTPGFEVFSWRVTGKKESVNGWVILMALALLFLGLVGFLGYNLARWRRTVL